jgi:hypothetical protein
MMRMINKIKVVNEFVRNIEELGYRIELSGTPNHYGYIYDGQKELCTLFVNAEELKAEGLRDGYKQLMDYNGYVLAMSETFNGYEFMSWQYSYDGKAVNLGRYFNDYESAKENMAIRCGLIDRSKMFTETEMKLIYTNLINYVGLDPNIKYKNEKAIGMVLDKIEGIVPEIVNHDKYEELELVSDDELEL